jgi:hypothetical protein
MFGLALAGRVGAQSPVEIADGRREAPWVDLSGWDARPAVQQAVAAARAYWQGQDPSYEEEVRVFAVAEGAFTEPGAGQQAVLYLMSLWPRCCPKMGLAVVEGERLVRNVAFEGTAQALSAVPDLDGDGRDELAYDGSFGMGGEESRSVMLVSFGAGGLAEWGGTSIYESNCATGAGDSRSTAARVLAVPGPAFTVERYAQPSCETATWEPVGGPEPLALTPSGVAYIELHGEPAHPEDGAAEGEETRHERGRLAAGDETLASGEYTDEYAVEGRQGQTLVLDLRATDFDPYLILAMPGGEQLDNDDFESDQTHSRIATTLPETGMYRVIVTSYAVGETGAYELAIHFGGGE